MLARSTAEMCTNTSCPPSSGWMKPKPFWPLNHFTTPVAISVSPSGSLSIHAPTMGGMIKFSERVEGGSGSRFENRGWRAGEPKRYSMPPSSHDLGQGAREFADAGLNGGDSALFYL